MRNKRRFYAIAVTGACVMLCACGTKDEEASPASGAALEAETESEQEKAAEEFEETPRQDTQAVSGESETPLEETSGRGAVLEDQSFEVSLVPAGEVRFVSYAPKDAYGDAVFVIERNGVQVMELKGMREGNICTEETFEMVEAVSFPDYNGDGNNDIIVICRYRPEDGTEAFSEARLYEGTQAGEFLLRKELSEEANLALAQITVESVKGFLGTDRTEPGQSAQAGWQQAYIEHIRTHGAENVGYVLIYLDDDEVPELVEVGDCEATGCRIVNFANGKIEETQLDRLYFSYIERGNLLCNSEGLMDVYYDYVYSLRDGKLEMIAKGNYGAADNSNIRFDENGEPIYEYYWNGEQMTKEAYDQALRAVYDTSFAKDGYQWDQYDSAETMIEKLEGPF